MPDYTQKTGRRKLAHDIPLTVEELQRIRTAVRDQNPFRRSANLWHDYYDQNQINEALRTIETELGMKPIVESYCHVAINANIGIWAKNKTEYTVLADTATEESDTISQASSAKLNAIEKRSGAEQATTEAYKTVLVSGARFLGISLENDPFKFPIKVSIVPRNEIFWDMSNPYDRTLQEAKWLVRERYVNIKYCKEHFESIIGRKIKEEEQNLTGQSLREESDWSGIEFLDYLQRSRGYSTDEKPLYKRDAGEVLLSEVLYRRWANTRLVRTKDGRVFDADYFPRLPDNERLLDGAEFFEEVTSRVRQSWAVGDVILSDRFSPVFRDDFHYAPFFGYLEELTGTPYGLMKSMVPLQDEVNLRATLQKYLMSMFRTIRPSGMFVDPDEVLRLKFGRGDADIVIDSEWVDRHPVAAGLFRIEHMQDLSEEQYRRLQDARQAIFAVAGVTPEWLGRSESKQDSGVKYNQMVEQASSVSAGLIEHFNFARKNLGRLLLDIAIDSMNLGEEVEIDGDLEGKTIVKLNHITEDGHIENDIYRHSLQVKLAEIPSSPSFKAQQAELLKDIVQSAPPQALPDLYVELLKNLQIPNAVKIARSVASKFNTLTEEDVQQQKDQAVKDALREAQIELKMKDLEQKEAKVKAEVDRIEAETVLKKRQAAQTGATTVYTAMQGGSAVAQNAAIVPVAQQILNSAGFEDKDSVPVISTVSAPMQTPPQDMGTPGVRQNTSPVLPPVPAQPASPMTGATEGIEKQGNQIIASGPAGEEVKNQEAGGMNGQGRAE
jgi:hypothetical protein